MRMLRCCHSSLTPFPAPPRAPRAYRVPVRPMPSVAAVHRCRASITLASLGGERDRELRISAIAPASADASFRRYFRITPVARRGVDTRR